MRRGHRWFFVRDFGRGSKWTCLPRISSVPLRHNRKLPTPIRAGAEILVRCLQAEGVKFLWGYPGGAVLYIYDALCTNRTPSSTCWCAMSRRPCTRPTATARHRRRRRRAGHLGPGRHQCRDRHRDRLHGLDPDGHHHRSGADATRSAWTPSRVRHRGHHAPASKHNFLVRTCATWPRRSRRPSHRRPPAGGPVVVDIPKDVAEDRAVHYPEVGMRSLQPGAQRATAGRSARRCSCCSRRDGRWSTPAAVWCWPTRRAELRELVELLGCPAPTR